MTTHRRHTYSRPLRPCFGFNMPVGERTQSVIAFSCGDFRYLEQFAPFAPYIRSLLWNILLSSLSFFNKHYMDVCLLFFSSHHHSALLYSSIPTDANFNAFHSIRFTFHVICRHLFTFDYNILLLCMKYEAFWQTMRAEVSTKRAMWRIEQTTDVAMVSRE